MSNKRPRDDHHNTYHSSSGPSPKHHKTHHNNNNHYNRNNNSTSNSNNPNTQPLRNQRPSTYTSRAPSLHKSHPSSQNHPTIPPYNTHAPLPLHANLPPLPRIEPKLASAPFTHSSVSSALNYEKLEFLGDAYLEIIATRLIYSHFPGLPSGRQAQLREKMIRNTTLAGFAKAYGFGDRVRGAAMLREEAKDKYEKMLADVFEAFVAAVVLSWVDGGGPGDDADVNKDDENKDKNDNDPADTRTSSKSKPKTKPKSGFEIAETWLTELWADILLTHETEGATLQASTSGNRKDELNRLIGGKEVKIEYLDLGTIPTASKGVKSNGVQMFEVGVYITGWGYDKVKLGVGKGVGKKEAGMVACLDAFERNKALIDEIAEVKRCEDEKRRKAMGLIQ